MGRGLKELAGVIERHLPGAEKRAEKRARRSGWTDDEIAAERALGPRGVQLDQIRVTPEARAKAAETMRRLGLYDGYSTTPYQGDRYEFNDIDIGQD